MSTPVPDAGVSVGVEATAQPATPETPTQEAPVSFADTSYDVLADLTLPDGTVLPAGSRTTPAALGLAGNIPAVHALVVAGQIWPTGVAR